ncbi:hypothetical protein ACHAW6_010899 [Cyclotella cf. meneghiniana]
MSAADRNAIERVYGPNPDLYQILNISKTASSTQIREAYFCLRYDIYQQLSNEAGGSALTERERKETEAKMDAITGAFRILTDPGKRMQYDSSAMEEEDRGNGDYYSDGRDKGRVSRGGGGPDEKRTANSRIHRSVFRRRGNMPAKSAKSDDAVPSTRSSAVPAGGGMQSVRPRAETVTGFRKSNLERSKSTEETSCDSESEEAAEKMVVATNKFAKAGIKSSIVAQRKQRQLRNRPSVSKESREEEAAAADHHAVDVPSNLNVSTASTLGAYQEHLPVGMDDLNIREQMLYKNQMYMHTAASPAHGNKSQARDNGGGRSRIASRYQTEERRDWLVSEEDETAMDDDDDDDGTNQEDDDRESRMSNKKRSSHRKNKVTSPTGVEDFESSRSFDNLKKDSSFKKESSRSKSKPSKSATSLSKQSRFSFDDETTKASSYRDDETRSQDDDTRTYDDTSTYFDDDTTNFDDTTMGDTIDETTVGESVLSYDDDTYASDVKKHSPSHKKGNRPQPILRGGEKYSSRSTKDAENRRVTIHSHRGRKGRSDDKDFASSMCPFPSMMDIKEEVRGTCKDASSAFHQVLHAFVISPDDIDRMSDKIRDAREELAENYQRQLKERKKVGSSGKESRR